MTTHTASSSRVAVPSVRLGVMAALLTCIADQFSKWLLLAVVDIDSRPPIHVTPFFDLVMVWNRGVSFGMLGQGDSERQKYFLVLMSLAICGGLLAWLCKNPSRLTAASLGLIIGGALGNVIDRLHLGAVADFFSFHIGAYAWPAFNIADSAICVGVAILFLESMLVRKS